MHEALLLEPLFVNDEDAVWVTAAEMDAYAYAKWMIYVKMSHETNV